MRAWFAGWLDGTNSFIWRSLSTKVASPPLDELREILIMEPSPWVVRFLSLVPVGGPVLDVASGSGRHARMFLERGNDVVAIDHDLSGIADQLGHPRLEAIEVDLEDGGPFPLAGRAFACVLVTNYLYRPIMPALVGAVMPGGVFIYETFAKGNERFGKPRNPDHLLEPGELLEAVSGKLRVLAYEDLIVSEPRPAAIQRICAINERSRTRARQTAPRGKRDP
jgi:SAM-dependent methyltransferase